MNMGELESEGHWPDATRRQPGGKPRAWRRLTRQHLAIDLDCLARGETAAWDQALPPLWEAIQAGIGSLGAIGLDWEDIGSRVLLEVRRGLQERRGSFARLERFEELIRMAWRIGRRRALDQVRLKGWQLTGGGLVGGEQSGGMQPSSTQPLPPSPDQLLLLKERELEQWRTWTRTVELIREITPRRRGIVLFLNLVIGLKQVEIAEGMGIPPGTVASDCARGVVKLRQLYLERYGAPDLE